MDKPIITTAHDGHGYAKGDVIEFTIPENRRWMRLYYRITFRIPPLRKIRATINEVNDTRISLK